MQLFQGVEVVDISHDIRKFTPEDAAFVLRSTVKHFPKGTVHIIAVSTEAGPESPHRIVKMMINISLSGYRTFHLIFERLQMLFTI